MDRTDRFPSKSQTVCGARERTRPIGTIHTQQPLRPGSSFYFYRGRTALYALLRALEVQPGDQVIVQAYTCLAVILPIIGLGATPVYADILPATYTMDPGAVAAQLTSRTRALIVQHTFGIPADLDNLLALARERGVPVIEDCCHVRGSIYRGCPLGSFGTAAFSSFHWSKPLAVGRGGRAVVNDPLIESRVANFHSTCSSPSLADVVSLSAQYLVFRLLRRRRFTSNARRLLRSWTGPMGFANSQFRRAELEYKITEDYSKKMIAPTRYLVEKMLRGETYCVERRRHIGRQLHLRATQLGISPVELDPEVIVAFMAYPLHTYERKEVIRQAGVRGIEVTGGFVSPVDPLPQSDWKDVGYRAGSCPVAEQLSEKTVTIPIHDWASDSSVTKTLSFLGDMKARRLIA